MAPDRIRLLTLPAAAALLLWPAFWNRYPIVFADTGTYLSQAIHHYAGWDRPIFYSLFMLPLHGTVTTWPVIVAQAGLTVWVLRLVCRTLVPWVPPLAFVGGVAVLATVTWLPWIVSELMPDVFTPLLVLILALLAWTPERLAPQERVFLAAVVAFMIACQQSSLPLACALALILGVARHYAGPAPDPEPGRLKPLRRWPLLIAPPVVAVLALCSVNFAAQGRFAVSPFGNIFLLARVVYDGPGMTALRQNCPLAHWRLCPFVGQFPDTSDDFLWTRDSPLYLAGGPKAVSADADAIIRAALIAAPQQEVAAAWNNAWTQLRQFDSGDGLSPWPDQVSHWIESDFPQREATAYARARQQVGELDLPGWLAQLHWWAAIAGVGGCLVLLPVALRQRAPTSGLLLAVIITLPLGAAITGVLSAPHDRYQSRIMWLPPFAAVVAAAALRRGMP